MKEVTCSDLRTAVEECRSLWRQLLNIPDNFDVLFVGGGIPVQQLMVPMNLLEKGAAYLIDGPQSQAALKEAKGIGRAVSITSTDDVPSDVDYLHVNGTIDAEIPAPVVACISRNDLFSSINIKKYSLLYADSDGMAVVIVRKDILGKVSRYLPTILNYSAYMNDGIVLDSLPAASIFAMLNQLKKER